MAVDLSIIIPTFNRLDFLSRAVDSCRDVGSATEIIVVDDGSDDGTWEWLQNQPGLVTLRQQNLGKGWAVNRAVQIARGEYIRFLDSDDRCLHGANDRQLEVAKEERPDIVVAGYAAYADEDTRLWEQPWIHCDDFVAQQLGECDSSHYSAYLFRREFIRDIPHRPEAGARDDRMFVIEAAIANPRVAVYEGLALAHRHHNGPRLQFQNGLAGTATNFHHLMVYRRCLRMLEQKGELTDRRKRAACNILWPLAHWIAYSHPEDGARVAEWIYEMVPDFVPPEAGILGRMYQNLGFRHTERLLKLRRVLVEPLRRLGERSGTSR